jgi:mono/diheme cytochrome c family protein
MSARFACALLLLGGLLALVGCRMPGKPAPGDEAKRPVDVLDPVVLYKENCAGCHGAEGKMGPAMALGDPVYLALVDDDALRRTISKGRAGTAMSAFAQSEGGMLTDQQINSIIHGIRERWGQPNVLAGIVPPAYAAKSPGNPQQGAAAFATFCASCHGVEGKGGPNVGSIVNTSYLSLITDQGLRTIVIAGRPDFSAPDWRSNVPGRPMTDQEITDVVAWLTAQRPTTSTTTAGSTTSTPGGLH